MITVIPILTTKKTKKTIIIRNAGGCSRNIRNISRSRL